MRRTKIILVIGTLLTAAAAIAGPGFIGFKPITQGTNELHTNLVSTNVFLGRLSIYDTNSDGTISSSEFTAGIARSANQRLTNFLAKYDGNSDATVTSAEILAVTQAASETWMTNLLGRYDRNADGSLSTNEVRRGAHEIGGPGITDLDVNGDGVISKTELVAGALVLAEDQQDEILENFDANKDGNVTSAEALAVFQKEEQGRVTQILDEFDANNDGEVTSAEISAVHQSRGGRSAPDRGSPGGPGGFGPGGPRNGHR